MSLRPTKPDRLRRLPKPYYQGFSWVHWSMTIMDRRRGWLDGELHAAIRELLLHTLTRHRLMCPAYCLMPDHGHFLLMGLEGGSDQLRAVQFFRRYWNGFLLPRGARLQKQPYDHVLEENEKDSEGFEDTCIYILENPQRAGLVTEWREWPYLGSLAPGYPDLDPREEDWRERFWRIHNKERESQLVR